MTADPDSTASLLGALRRYFLLRYREIVLREHAIVRGAFPLHDGSRLDLVRVNGGSRVHFLYRDGTPGEHLVVVHDLTLVGTEDEEVERRFVAGAIRAEASLAHFVLAPPYDAQFERVEREAVEAVGRHAQRRPHPSSHLQN